jgi:hypothetical protein
MISPASRRITFICGRSAIGRYLLDRNLLNSRPDEPLPEPERSEAMTLVNSLCAEISIFEGIGEPTGVVVERSAIRGKKGLCKSMRDLAIKSRVLGDGYYYIPIELWPKSKQPVVVHKHDWTVIGSIPRTSRSAKKRVKPAVV